MKISSLFRGSSDVTPLATVCVSGHLVSTPLANVPWLVSLTAPATALLGVPEIRPLGLEALLDLDETRKRQVLLTPFRDGVAIK